MQQEQGAVAMSNTVHGQVHGNRIVYNNNNGPCLNCNFCVCINTRGRVILGFITFFYLALTISSYAIEMPMMGNIFLCFFAVTLLLCIWNFYRWKMQNQMQPTISYGQVPAQQVPVQQQPVVYPSPHQYPPQNYPPHNYYPGQPAHNYPGAQAYPGQAPQSYPAQGQTTQNYPSYPPYSTPYPQNQPHQMPPQDPNTAVAKPATAPEPPPPSYEDATKGNTG